MSVGGMHLSQGRPKGFYRGVDTQRSTMGMSTLKEKIQHPAAHTGILEFFQGPCQKLLPLGHPQGAPVKAYYGEAANSCSNRHPYQMLMSQEAA